MSVEKGQKIFKTKVSLMCGGSTGLLQQETRYRA